MTVFIHPYCESCCPYSIHHALLIYIIRLPNIIKSKLTYFIQVRYMLVVLKKIFILPTLIKQSNCANNNNQDY